MTEFKMSTELFGQVRQGCLLDFLARAHLSNFHFRKFATSICLAHATQVGKSVGYLRSSIVGILHQLSPITQNGFQFVSLN
jgi:hypothetical protein